MTEERDHGAARALLTELTADVLAWVEQGRDTGVQELPWDNSPAVAPIQPAAPSPSRSEFLLQQDSPPPLTPRRPETKRSPASGTDSGRETLEDVRRDLGECQRCGLHQGRTHIVFGVGSAGADLVVVGEAPGFHEDRSGEPFVGRAGQLLTRMLAAIGVSREQAYICNVLKCRPPDNRDPTPHEVATCSPFMSRQLQAIQPRVILTTGRFAANTLLQQELAMGRLRGQVHQWQGIPLVPTYHPAYLLRTPAAKARTWEDLLLVRDLLTH